MTISSAGIELAVKRTGELFAEAMASYSPETVEGNVKRAVELCAPGYKAAFIARLERDDLIRSVKSANRQQSFVQTMQATVVKSGSNRYDITIPGQIIVAQVGERHFSRNMVVTVKVEHP